MNKKENASGHEALTRDDLVQRLQALLSAASYRQLVLTYRFVLNLLRSGF